MGKLAIVGDKIILQEFTRDNLVDKKYHEWLRDLDIVTQLYRMEYLKPLEFTQIEQYVETLLQSDTDCFFAIYDKATHAFIGTHRLGHINWRSGVADVGIMIGDKNYWGKGLASEVLKLSIQYAFKTLSLRKLIGGTSRRNVAMCKCFERAGFVLEGVKREELLIDGEYVDHALYGLLKKEMVHA